MGNVGKLGPFDEADAFLRRIDRKSRVDVDGTISHAVFKPRDGEESLSFTYQDRGLRNQIALEKYQQDTPLPSGDLPGICKLTYRNLTEEIEPPLEPRPDPSDALYGHLHCVTDLPNNVEHMEMLAKLATRNGLLLPFRRKAK